MITDNQTNCVYFSAFIKEDKKYEQFWRSLEPKLIKNKIPYGFIENTRDIWCRDYMPVQKSDSEFVQFSYFPDYLLAPKWISKLTIPSETEISDRIKPTNSELIIDGGNVVKSPYSVILTDKIFSENHTLSHDEITARLKHELSVRNVFIIPKQPDDYTGHADGMVRFINENTLAVSDYSYLPVAWRKKMDAALDKTGLNLISFPSHISEEKNEDGDYTAIGNYINFIQVGNKVLFPQFEIAEDKYALRKAKEILHPLKVIPVKCSDIAMEGGGLHCISWNVKIMPTMSFNKLNKQTPCLLEQQKYVYEHIDFYLSTPDYNLMACGFESIWNQNLGNITGDGDFKNMMYRFLESAMDRNHIPQKYVDKTVDLILEYMESIGQYGFDFTAN